VRRLAFWNYLP
jgi:hypothetical protein